MAVGFGNELRTTLGALTVRPLEESLGGLAPLQLGPEPDMGEIGAASLADLPEAVIGGFDDHAVMLHRALVARGLYIVLHRPIVNSVLTY